MKIYTITQAQANFDRLVDEALAGEEVIIARRKTPLAKLEPIPPKEDQGKGTEGLKGTAQRRGPRSRR